MAIFSIPISKTGKYPPLILDYVNKTPELRDRYSFNCDIDSFENIIDQRNHFKTDRKTLVDELKKQYHTLKNPVHANVQNNIEKLLLSHTYTVTTGHQLNILSGPVFSIYKILSVIKLAEDITARYSTIHVVPVFWMASEDHDMDEIDHFYYKSNKYRWTHGSSGASGKVQTNTIDSFLLDVKNMNPELTYNSTFNLFVEAYRNHGNLADATFEIVSDLFGKYGIVVMNADSPQLKSLFKNETRDDIIKNSVWNDVSATNKQLSKKYKLLVNPRKINTFYMQDGVRERIIEDTDGGYIVNNTEIRFTKEELLAELVNRPEHFSPNVIMRTMYQEKILPNLAYVGGPGELSYWLQFKEAFNTQSVSFPILMLRNSFLLIDSKTASSILKLKLKYEDLFLKISDLEKQIALRDAHVFDAEEAINKMSDIYSIIENNGMKIDKTLKYPVQGELKKSIKSIKKLHKKIIRAVKRNDEEKFRKLRLLHEYVFPNNSMQERTANIVSFADNGFEELANILYDHTDPFNNDLTVIEI
jgi:bacillithiol synthase